MTDLTALPALLARVEAATGGDRALDVAIHQSVTGDAMMGEHIMDKFGFGTACPLYTTSIDAAVALVEKLRPGWYAISGHNVAEEAPSAHELYFCKLARHRKLQAIRGYGHTEVLARLAALLRSMIEEEGR